MSKRTNEPHSLSDAIEQLENSGKSKAEDIKEIFEKDFKELKKAIEELKPQLNNLKDSVEVEIKKTKRDVEKTVKDNPLLTVGIVGLIAFIIGWLVGGQRRD